MANKRDFPFEELVWKDVRQDVKSVSPRLAAIIDEFSPDDSYSFIKVRYQYGDFILKKGELHLPYQDHTLPITDPKIPRELKSKLSYGSVPLSLILSKSVEIFFETDERCMPSKLFPQGSMFGLWEAFDPLPSEFVKRVWNLTAGARTTFLLPKVSDFVSHNRLKRTYGIHSYPPKRLLDHHKIFVELAKKIDTEKEWHCDILFFSRKWLEDKEDDIAYLKLHRRWILEAWNQSYNCRTQMSYDIAWEEFSREVNRRNYKPRANTINVIKHLLSIGEGIFPGFIPSPNNEDALPVKLIQDAYVNTYLLKGYAPIIMQPHHLSEGESAYYSLSLPTQLEYSPQISSGPSIMADSRELKMLLDILQESLKEKSVDYSFFHSEEDKFNEIKSAAELVNIDPRFQDCIEQYPGSHFCDNSQFWRGAIRVDRK